MNRLERALAETRIEGIRTTKQLFQALLTDDDFRAGRLDNGMLDRKLASGELGPAGVDDWRQLSLISAAIEHAERATRSSALPPAAGGRRGHWRDAGRRESMRGDRWS